jgi:hypothetical protein
VPYKKNLLLFTQGLWKMIMRALNPLVHIMSKCKVLSMHVKPIPFSPLVMGWLSAVAPLWTQCVSNWSEASTCWNKLCQRSIIDLKFWKALSNEMQTSSCWDKNTKTTEMSPQKIEMKLTFRVCRTKVHI